MDEIYEDYTSCRNCGNEFMRLVVPGLGNNKYCGSCQNILNEAENDRQAEDALAEDESQAYQDAGEAAAHIPGAWA